MCSVKEQYYLKNSFTVFQALSDLFQSFWAWGFLQVNYDLKQFEQFLLC